MCPSCNGDTPLAVNGLTNGIIANGQPNGIANGVNGHAPHNPRQMPFSLPDYLSNVSNFKVPTFPICKLQRENART